MNKFNLVLCIVLCIGLFSCAKKTEDVPTPQYPTSSPKKAFEKKWNVTSVTRVAATSSVATLQSIEFMLNTYIAKYSNDSTIVGKYTSLNSTTLVLNDFGTVTIVTVSESQFNFVLSQDGKPDVTVSSLPGTVISNTFKTTALSNTWICLRTTVSDTTIRVQSYPTLEGENIHIVFSQYGTYLQRNTSPGAEDRIENGTWAWSDASQAAFKINGTSGTEFNVTFTDNYSKLNFDFTEFVSGLGNRRQLTECLVQ